MSSTGFNMLFFMPNLSLFHVYETSLFGLIQLNQYSNINSLKSEILTDANTFVFSLTNKDNKPVKKKIDPIENEYAIICDFEYGPTFGCDIKIDNNANTSINSYSNL
jgi:hypothetical protein